jgi:hypothetical protein
MLAGSKGVEESVNLGASAKANLQQDQEHPRLSTVSTPSTKLKAIDDIPLNPCECEYLSLSTS